MIFTNKFKTEEVISNTTEEEKFDYGNYQYIHRKYSF